MTRRPAPHDPVATDLLRLRASTGADVGDLDRLPPRARRALAVAMGSGAPAVEALDGAAAAEDDARRAERAVAVASAQTRTVAGGLLVAPILLVPGLARLVGADLAGFYTTPVGMVVGAAGGLLMLAGVLVVWRLVRRVGTPPARGQRPAVVRLIAALAAAVVAGYLVHLAAAPVAALLVLRRPRTADGGWNRGVDEAADLTATAMAGGMPPGEALRVAAVQLPDLAAPLRRLAFDLELGHGGGSADGTPMARLGAVLVTAHDVGAPSVPTLRRLARDLRAEELARVLAAAERLPAQLTFPTTLCLLPATVLLVGAPIVHAGLTATGT